MKKIFLGIFLFSSVSACKSDSELAGSESRLYLDSLDYQLEKEGEDPQSDSLVGVDDNLIELSSGSFNPSDFYRFSLSEERLSVEVKDQEGCGAFIEFALTPIGEDRFSAVPSYRTEGCTIELGDFADEVESVLSQGANGIPVRIERSNDRVTVSVDEYLVEQLVGDLEGFNDVLASGTAVFKTKSKPELLTRIEAVFADLFL